MLLLFNLHVNGNTRLDTTYFIKNAECPDYGVTHEAGVRKYPYKRVSCLKHPLYIDYVYIHMLNYKDNWRYF